MTASLQRRLGVADAVTVGAGSMIGAGVFSAWGPAAGAAGTGLLIGLALVESMPMRDMGNSGASNDTFTVR